MMPISIVTYRGRTDDENCKCRGCDWYIWTVRKLLIEQIRLTPMFKCSQIGRPSLSNLARIICIC